MPFIAGRRTHTEDLPNTRCGGAPHPHDGNYEQFLMSLPFASALYCMDCA